MGAQSGNNMGFSGKDNNGEDINYSNRSKPHVVRLDGKYYESLLREIETLRAENLKLKKGAKK